MPIQGTRLGTFEILRNDGRIIRRYISPVHLSEIMIIINLVNEIMIKYGGNALSFVLYNYN